MVIDVQIVSLSAEQLLHSLIDRPKVRRPEKLVVGLITSFDADDDKLALDVSIPPPVVVFNMLDMVIVCVKPSLFSPPRIASI